MKFTPGPWVFDGDNPMNQGFDVAMQDGGILATAYYDVGRDEYSAQQAEANAHLIAAAPDLLLACEVALLKFKHSPLDLISIAADIIRAAIAKAKGEPS